MPIEVREMKTKSGQPVLRAEFIKEVTLAEARRYHEAVLPGGSHEMWGHLIVGSITGVSSEVRKLLESRKADPRNPPPISVVFESALGRMAASLASRGGGNPNTEFFKTEQDALDWLDGAVREYIRKGPPR